MASPVTQALPTAGNLYAAASLAAGKNVGVFYDTSAWFEAALDVRETTGSSAASTSGVSISCYHVYAGTTTTTTITGTSTTSITVASATGLAAGMKAFICNSSGVGELLSITSISGTTLTVTAPNNSYSGTTSIYLISQTALVTGPTLGQNLTAGNTTYGAAVILSTERWMISLVNLDATNAVTVELTACALTGVQ